MQFKTILVSSCALLLWLLPQSAAAQGSYQTETVSNPGTITGTVKWKGAAPQPVVLPITKNPDICDPQQKKTRDLERILVGPDESVANTVVFLKDISKGKAMELPTTRRQLNQKTCRYEPHIYLVPKETMFEMKSSDPILHNIHMIGAAFYNIPFPIQDKVISRSMHKDGVVDIKCDAGHVWMNSEVLVVDHPYYAITDAHGNFKLTGVPPGNYTIEAWHEGWHVARTESVTDVDTHQQVNRPIFTEPKTWDKQVTVSANGSAKVDFDISE